MASSYSNSLKIQLMANGEDSNTWGTITNTNWNLMEQAVTGVDTIVMANANYTLTNLNGISDEARNMVIIATGTTGGAGKQIIAPLVQKFYIVYNNTSDGYSVNIGASSGAVITIPSGVTAQVYCDGSNFYSAQTGSAGNFLVNGNLSVTGSQVDVGNMSIGGTLGVTGAASLNGGGTSTTPTTGDNTTKIATTAFVNSSITANPSVLTGSIQMWPTASAPTGYLLCAGAAVSRATYAALFAVIGTTFGVGDGSTTFNLPDYTGRSPLGANGSYALASTGGSADAVVVSHTHTAAVTDPGHSHSLTSNVAALAGGSSSGANNSYNLNFPGVTTNSATTGITVTPSTTGVSGTNANLQPYLAINFIIKT